jgi:hypothetical protein
MRSRNPPSVARSCAISPSAIVAELAPRVPNLGTGSQRCCSLWSRSRHTAAERSQVRLGQAGVLDERAG